MVALFRCWRCLLLLAVGLSLNAAVSVSVSPSTATVKQGATQTFKATVSGTTNTSVTWTVVGGSSGGTVTTAGIYRAPAKAGTYKVRATSKASTTKYAEATVTVPAVTVAVSPSTATVDPGATRTFTATVGGTTNTAVTWSVAGSGGGTVSTSGVFTAPSTPGTCTVRATSKANTAVYADATVTVTGLGVTVSPASATVDLGATRTFTAAVSGTTNTEVTWSVAGGGSIDASGVFTAPTTAGTSVVKATSVADPSRSSTATVTVPVKVSLNPPSATVNQGGAQSVAATVLGSSNTSVTWSCSGGAISTSGVWTAPGAAGSYTVTATSVATPQGGATATFTVPSVGVSVSPATATVGTGGTQAFTAAVTGTVNTAVTWTASSGSITTGGLWTASATAGTSTITATSKADTTRKASATVTVQAGIKVTVSTGAVTLAPGSTQVFLASVANTSNGAVTWSVDGGACNGVILPSGIYFAPQIAGTYTVRATSVADPTRSGTATVTVQGGATWRVDVAPLEVTVAPGEALTFQAQFTDLTDEQQGGYSYTMSSSAGALQSLGDGAFTWTAPAAAGDYTVTVKVSGTSCKGMALIHVRPVPTGVSVAVTPGSLMVLPGQGYAFQAQVRGSSNTGVTWSCSAGSIDTYGYWSAPESAGTFTVTATSVADPTRSATATVVVPVRLTFAYSHVTVRQGEETAFLVTVMGLPDPSVTWSLSGGGRIIETVGNGPDSWCTVVGGTAPGTYSLTARSVADPSIAAVAAMVVPKVGITVTPSSLTVPAGDSILIGDRPYGCSSRVEISGTMDTAFNSSVVSGGGHFDPVYSNGDWIFHSPYSGSATLKITSHADPTCSAMLTVDTTDNPEPVLLSFTAEPCKVMPGGTASLLADFGNGPGIVTPGDLAMTPGLPLPVSPAGSTLYKLLVTGSGGNTVTARTFVGVAGPGSFEGTTSPLLNFQASFSNGGHLAMPVTLLDREGRVVVVGEQKIGELTGTTVERYDPKDGSWTVSVQPSE